MDTALSQKYPFILDKNLAKANCTENRVCTSCDIVGLDSHIINIKKIEKKEYSKYLYKNACDIIAFILLLKKWNLKDEEFYSNSGRQAAISRRLIC